MLGDFDDSDPGLVGYWKMNAGEGDILYDHSGNANHGTINGGAEWSNDEPVIVTFQYDAYDQIVSSNGIHIAGTFNNWSTSLSEMIDVDGDSVYTFSAAFSAGDVVEYKIINGNTWNDTHDIFSGDENCVIANENDFNRVITVLEEDMILDPVCINSCDPCDHPDIDVSPEFLSSDLYVGESETHTVSIINEGVINLDWTSYVSFSDDQNTVESTPEFGTGLIGDNRKINDDIVPNFDTYTSDPIRISANESDLASRNGNNTPIDQILSNFNEN